MSGDEDVVETQEPAAEPQLVFVNPFAVVGNLDVGGSFEATEGE